ncbi:hypothetical protein ACOMHN_018614 [Nucella lapillus]
MAPVMGDWSRVILILAGPLHTAGVCGWGSEAQSAQSWLDQYTLVVSVGGCSVCPILTGPLHTLVVSVGGGLEHSLPNPGWATIHWWCLWVGEESRVCPILAGPLYTAGVCGWGKRAESVQSWLGHYTLLVSVGGGREQSLSNPGWATIHCWCLWVGKRAESVQSWLGHYTLLVSVGGGREQSLSNPGWATIHCWCLWVGAESAQSLLGHYTLLVSVGGGRVCPILAEPLHTAGVCGWEQSLPNPG